MKRMSTCLLVGFLAVSLAGCCYRPGYINHYTGMAYGGSWEPVCGGPLDPFGFWCLVSYGPCGYGTGYPASLTAGSLAGDCGCDACAGPVGGYPVGGTMMSQQPCGQGGPCHSAPQSGGALKPVPDPMTSPAPRPAPGTSTTWVAPAPQYVAPVTAGPTPLPTAQPTMMPTAPSAAPAVQQSASQQLWIQAY